MNRILSFAIASALPPVQPSLLLGAVISGHGDFTIWQWIVGTIVPFGAWGVLLFG
jgi:hypothetical protein